MIMTTLETVNGNDLNNYAGPQATGMDVAAQEISVVGSNVMITADVKAETTAPKHTNKQDAETLKNMATRAYKAVEPDLAKKGKKNKKGITNAINQGNKAKSLNVIGKHFTEALTLMHKVNPNAVNNIAQTPQETKLLKAITKDTPKPNKKFGLLMGGRRVGQRPPPNTYKKTLAIVGMGAENAVKQATPIIQEADTKKTPALSTAVTVAPHLPKPMKSRRRQEALRL